MTIKEHIDHFLGIRMQSPYDYKTEYTIKFFKKENGGKLQNSILINIEDRTVRDMRIEDPEVFKLIVDEFSEKKEENEANNEVNNDKKVALRGMIDIDEFVERIFNEETDAVIGFISHLKWEENERMPGSQVLNYTINSYKHS